MALSAPVGLLYWYTTSAILGFLTLLNIVFTIHRYYTRPRRSFLPSNLTSLPTSYEKSRAIEPRRSRGNVEKFGLAVLTGWEKYVVLTALPIPKIQIQWWSKARSKASSWATTELTWGVGYTLGNFVLCFYGTAWEARAVANQAGWLAVAQVPLIITLAGKNNLVACLTGISYEKLNFLHRAAGRVCLATVWIHAVGYWYINTGYAPGAWKMNYVRWGITGLLSFSVMYLTSITIVRRRLYEFFLVTHICLAALTLGAFIMHWRAVDVWIYPGIGLWAADRLFRIIRLIILNKVYPTSLTVPPTSSATLHLLTPSTLKITFPTPSHLNWNAGQHFYVILPTMSRLPWEAHPFTAATISGELTFIVRVRDGFTKMMKDKVDEERKSRGLNVADEDDVGVKVQGVVEGPYGIGRDLSQFNGVLILAGGSGISFAVAHLLQIVKDAREGRTRVTHVKVVWMVKSRLHLNWISPILLANTQNLPPNLHISLDIHVTKHYLRRPSSISLPPTAILPEDPSSTSMDWQTYMAKRAARPRRRSRLLSTFSWASWTRRSQTGLSGPGTRRGSEAVLPGLVNEPKASKKVTKGATEKSSGDLEVDVEKGNEESEMERDKLVPPTFTWSDSYGQGQGFPTVGNGELPWAKRDRFSSGVPDIAIEEALDHGAGKVEKDAEEEEQKELSDLEEKDLILEHYDSSGPSSPASSRRYRDLPGLGEDRMFDNPSPFSSARGRQSLSISAACDSSLKRAPFALQELSSGSPPDLLVPRSFAASRGRQSLSIPAHLNTVARRKSSITFDESPSRPSSDGYPTPRHSLSVPILLTSPSRRKSITFDEPSPRTSLDTKRLDDIGEPVSPRQSRLPLPAPSPLSVPSLLHPSPRRQSILTIEEPSHPRRPSTPLRHSSMIPRDYSPFQQGSDHSPTSSRKESLVAPEANHLTVPGPGALSIQLQTPGETTTTFDDAFLSPTTTLFSPSTLSPTSHEMTKTTSDNSILSIPHLPSGALTPAVSDLNETISPLHPLSAPAQAFSATSDLRRRQSIGLESLIHWHEGRADLEEVVRGMMVDVGVENGGWVDVSACGPRSLLDSAKGVVKGLSSVKATWKSGGGVRYSAETFGW